MVDGHIKKACKEIMGKFSDTITIDFEENKHILNEITDIGSNKMRNQIAGRLVTMKKNEKRIITSPYKGRRDRDNRRGDRRR